MNYKWIFVKNNKGEYEKIKCFILEEKQNIDFHYFINIFNQLPTILK